MQRSTSNLDMNGYNEIDDKDDKKKRGRSPFRLFGKKRDQSKEKIKGKHEMDVMEKRGQQGRNVIQSNLVTRAPTVRISNADLRVQAPMVPDRQKSFGHIESIGNEVYDAECLKLINEYFYGVRIFPGQDPTHVYVGWVTTQYHLHTHDFKQEKVRTASIIIDDDYEQIVEQ
jgi:ryanodine receptor 2